MTDPQALRAEHAALWKVMSKAAQRLVLAKQLQQQTPPSSAEHKKASQIAAKALGDYLNASLRRADVECILDPASPEAIERASWKRLESILEKARNKTRTNPTDEALRGRSPRSWAEFKSVHTPPG